LDLLEQRRLSEERWKLGPDEKPLPQELKEFLVKNFQRLKKLVTSVELPKNLWANLTKLKFKVTKNPKVYGLIAGIIALFLPLFLVLGQGNRSDVPKSLGVSSEQSTGTNDGKTDEKPAFSILYPQGKKDLLEVTRRTPTGVLLHTYRDSLEGTEIEVTQQELPESFKTSPSTELEKMAKSFQATDVIQIDQSTIFHGLDEKTRVQSLFTIKANVLISIRSAIKLSDDIWAAYFLSLN
jgi:hypothetical protein